jgi:hypothetical protein
MQIIVVTGEKRDTKKGKSALCTIKKRIDINLLANLSTWINSGLLQTLIQVINKKDHTTTKWTAQIVSSNLLRDR